MSRYSARLDRLESRRAVTDDSPTEIVRVVVTGNAHDGTLTVVDRIVRPIRRGAAP